MGLLPYLVLLQLPNLVCLLCLSMPCWAQTYTGFLLLLMQLPRGQEQRMPLFGLELLKRCISCRSMSQDSSQPCSSILPHARQSCTTAVQRLQLSAKVQALCAVTKLVAGRSNPCVQVSVSGAWNHFALKPALWGLAT